MKRIVSIILSLAMLLALASCAGKESAVQEVTCDEFYFGITKAENNVLTVLCENKSEETLDFSWSDAYVNGYQMNPSWSESVPAGESMESSITFSESLFERCGVSVIDEVKYVLRVSFDTETELSADTEDTDDAESSGFTSSIVKTTIIANDTFTAYPTGKSADSVEYNARRNADGESVLVDNDNYTVVIIDTDTESDIGYDFNVYIENKSDTTLVYVMRDVTLNGESVSPLWAKTLLPGTRAYSKISFTTSELQECGITDVEKLAFNLCVYADGDSDNLLTDDTFEYTPIN